MSSTYPLRRIAWLFLLPWILYAAIYYAGLTAVHQRYGDIDLVAARAALGGLLSFVIAAVLDRTTFGDKKATWPQKAFVGVVIFVCTLAWIVGGNAIIDMMRQPLGTGRAFADYFSGATINVYVQLAWLALYFDERARRNAAHAALQAAHARASARDAQLRLLAARLNPHFLFNTLNSIRVLARGGRTEEVVRMVDGLASLLRRLLEDEPWRMVPLRIELKTVQEYLEIQSIRFSDRLSTSYEIDKGAEAALVPGQILQPLIENAVIHGMKGITGPVAITLRARQLEDLLEVELVDVADRSSHELDEPIVDGHGLSNVRERLNAYYPGKYTLEIYRTVESTRVRLTFPFRLVER